MSRRRPLFVPLRRASRLRRELLLVIGPLLWLGALASVAVVIHHTDAVRYALFVLSASLAVSLLLLSLMRAGRVRRERRR